MIRLIFIFSTCSSTTNQFTVEFILHFMSSLFNNFKKLILNIVSTPKVGVLNVEFTLKLRIYRSLKTSQTNLKKAFHNTAYSVQLPYKAGLSL